MSNQPRAARWLRVSSAQQATSQREGLPYQEDLIEQAMRTLNCTDTGLKWVITHSGGSVHETAEWAEMISRAGKDFDVLICGYSSRLSRDTEQVLAAVRQIHAAGASIYMAEEAIDTGNESQWRQFATQAVAAEAYRRELSIVMRRTSESGWRRTGKQRGRAPMGYNADWSINPEAAEKVRTIFREYGTGDYSIEQLAARHQIAAEALKNTLRSKVYLGLASHRVFDPALPRLSRYLRPRQWREGAHTAIISEEEWERAADVRHARTRAGGQRPTDLSPLSRRLVCACGTPIRMDGRDRQGSARVRHPEPCEAFGRHQRKRAEYYLEPIRQGMSQIQLSDEAIERIIKDRPETTRTRVIPPSFARQRAQIAKDLEARRNSG
jgi:DNA invertase Pin-like site-specific DNA recombinase